MQRGGAGHTVPPSSKRRRDDPRGNSHREFMQKKKAKLEQQFQDTYGAAPSQQSQHAGLFAGVSVYFNGYCEPSTAELKDVLGIQGGNVETYYSRAKVTHVVAMNLSAASAARFAGCVVVHPTFITDSNAAGVLLPVQQYRLAPSTVGALTIATDAAAGLVTSPVAMPAPQPSLVYQRAAASLSSSERLITQPHAASASSPAPLTQDMAGARSSERELTELPAAAAAAGAGAGAAAPLQPATASEADVCIATNLDTCKGERCSGADEDAPKAVAGAAAAAVTAGVSLSPPGGAPRPAASKIGPAGPHSTLSDPNFVANFYQSSRLHHLSESRMKWKDYTRNLLNLVALQQQIDAPDTQAAASTPEARADGGGGGGDGGDVARAGVADRRHRASLIFHVDMDSFFSSVAIRDRPHLRGLPVVVTHSTSAAGNGEIASASYEARAFGIRNGSWLKSARELCPELVTVPYEFEKYDAVSRSIYKLFLSYTHTLEAVSCDEALLDMAAFASRPVEIAQQLRRRILEQTGCTASIGVGRNVLLAKLATRRAKPDGLYHLHDEQDIRTTLRDLPLRQLPNVGRKLAARLAERGISTGGELMLHSEHTLQQWFGDKTGSMLFRYARGQDDRKLAVELVRKSVGSDITWGVRFTDLAHVAAFLEQLAGEVARRLASVKAKGRVISLRVMERDKAADARRSKHLGHGACITHTRTIQLASYTDDAAVLAREALNATRALHIAPRDLRGFGLHVTKLNIAAEQHRRQAGLQRIDTAMQRATGDTDALQQQQQLDDAGEKHIDGTGAGDQLIPSQVDQDVWVALPASVQDELRGEQQRRRVLRALRRTPQPAQPGGEQQQTLTAMLSRQRRVRPSKQHGALATAALQDLALQDIDAATLAALPVELRREVLLHARRRAEPGEAETGQHAHVDGAGDAQGGSGGGVISAVLALDEDPERLCDALCCYAEAMAQRGAQDDQAFAGLGLAEALAHVCHRGVTSCQLDHAHMLLRCVHRLAKQYGGAWRAVTTALSPWLSQLVLQHGYPTLALPTDE